MENYYAANEKSFMLSSNIVKALFIKLPVETPDIDKIKIWHDQMIRMIFSSLKVIVISLLKNLMISMKNGFQWTGFQLNCRKILKMRRIFLRETHFLKQATLSRFILISIRDYRLRSSLAPFEYVKNDIKRIIWNTRRFEFIQSLRTEFIMKHLKKIVLRYINN